MFIKYGAPLAHGDGERRNQGETSTVLDIPRYGKKKPGENPLYIQELMRMHYIPCTFILYCKTSLIRQLCTAFDCFCRERRGKYPHKKFSSLSLEFPVDDPQEFPHESTCIFGGRRWLAYWVVKSDLPTLSESKLNMGQIMKFFVQ